MPVYSATTDPGNEPAVLRAEIQRLRLLALCAEVTNLPRSGYGDGRGLISEVKEELHKRISAEIAWRP